MKIVGRPREQRGYLFQKSGSWIGRYRWYGPKGKVDQRSMRIGSIDEMGEPEARKLLKAHIHQVEFRSKVVRRIGSIGVPPLDPNLVEKIMPSSKAQNKGAISELLVSAELMLRGLHVFRAMSPGAPCDLLVMDQEGNIVRVEVKTGRINSARQFQCSIRRNLGKFDVAAFVSPNGTIEYREAACITDDLLPLGKSAVQILAS